MFYDLLHECHCRVIAVNLTLTQRRHWKDKGQDCQTDCPDAITEEPGSRDGRSEEDGRMGALLRVY